MNILFLTISEVDDIEQRGIYTDLLRKFRDEKHTLYVVSPLERKFKTKTFLKKTSGINVLRVKTLNLLKTNIIEKGIGTVLIDYQYLKAIKKYFDNIKFDLLLYSTPPISFIRVVKKIKAKNKAFSYLLLKDIFPQNAVDIELIKPDGMIYRFFRRKEKELYEISDYIGCMSPANVEFLKKNNPQIPAHKIEICPNSIAPVEYKENIPERITIRQKLNIPQESIVFIYGGNLGKPQGLGFLLDVLSSNKEKNNCFFLIVGSGTEFFKIKNWFNKNRIINALLIQKVPKDDYDSLLSACDVGLIFLDPRFTVPNYPSRLLPYLEKKMPVLAATDINTDIGKIAEENKYGFWCENGDLEKFNYYIDFFINNPHLIQELGHNGYSFLHDNYTVNLSYSIIIKHFT